MTPAVLERSAPGATTVSFPRSDAVEAIVRLALAEDVGRGDITTEACVSPSSQAVAEVWQKAPGVICGLPLMELIFKLVDPQVDFTLLVVEGSAGEQRRLVARISGPAASILIGERTALNFIQRLSGVATASARAAKLVEGTTATIIDTRKTTPGMRVLEKYAVRLGGCKNHRAGLDDAFLIKENHIRAAGGISAALAAAKRRAGPFDVIEIEVTNLTELDEAIAAEPDIILLDNFDPPLMRQAVRRAAGRVRLEASGGITLDNLREVAQTGVTYVSLGALTHSAGSIDFSLVIV
jgi:nicotinate-nucleotide pyrophosphorylase (carboxylating)